MDKRRGGAKCVCTEKTIGRILAAASSGRRRETLAVACLKSTFAVYIVAAAADAACMPVCSWRRGWLFLDARDP